MEIYKNQNINISQNTSNTLTSIRYFSYILTLINSVGVWNYFTKEGGLTGVLAFVGVFLLLLWLILTLAVNHKLKLKLIEVNKTLNVSLSFLQGISKLRFIGIMTFLMLTLLILGSIFFTYVIYFELIYKSGLYENY